MASSPTSSSQSSYSSPFSSSWKFTDLPVTALRDKIVEKIQENCVTLIVGETGCGKSSQVLQFFLEENMEPILCTQPRRFTVVTVARMVAKARNCEVRVRWATTLVIRGSIHQAKTTMSVVDVQCSILKAQAHTIKPSL